jgi:Raf kinase inhibitor-like YbhB/YbcL family protein
MRAVAAIAIALGLLAAPASFAAGTITLSSPDFAADSPMPFKTVTHPPALTWTAVPGAQAYAITLQDTDAPMDRPFVHWIVWNIPGDATSLPDGGPHGLPQGHNDAGYANYYGPHPPSGTHHYHFHIYALDAPLSLHGGANLDAVMDAMRGHVLADGELVGTFS